MPDLGYQPQSGYNVNLGTDNDFVQTFTRKDGDDWPTGTVITLVLGGASTEPVSWPAEIDGPLVSWNVDKAVVNAFRAAVNGNWVPAKITYTDATGLDVTWVTGTVSWFADLGLGDVIVTIDQPTVPALQVPPPAASPLLVVPVPGVPGPPGSSVDFDVDPHGKYILECGGPADGTGA